VLNWILLEIAKKEALRIFNVLTQFSGHSSYLDAKKMDLHERINTARHDNYQPDLRKELSRNEQIIKSRERYGYKIFSFWI